MARCWEMEKTAPFQLPSPPESELLNSPLRRIEDHLRRIENSINSKFQQLQNDIMQNGVVVTRLDQVDQKLQELSRISRDLAEASQKQMAAATSTEVIDREAEQSAKKKPKEAWGNGRATAAGVIGCASTPIVKSMTNARSEHHHASHSWYDKTLVMNPRSRRATIWSFLVAMAVVYVCFAVPFQIGFSWWRKPQLHGYFDQALEVFFWIDMLQSFRTGFEHDGHLVMNLKEIAKHYLEMWFWVDLLANFPWEAIIGQLLTDKRQRKSIKGLKWLKLSKLLRLARWVKIMNEIGGGVGHIVNLCVQVACLILSVHCAACTLMFFQDPCAAFPPGDQDWKYNEDVEEDKVLASLGVRCLQTHVFSQYGEAVHSAAAIVIGASRCLFTYTDVLEGDLDAWLFVTLALWQLLGIFLIGKLISHLAKNTLMQNSRESLFWLQQDAAKKELEQYGAYLSGRLRTRIKSRFKLHFQKSDYGRLQLLSDSLLPKSLRLEVAMALYGRTVHEVEQLRNAPRAFLCSFCLALRLERYLAGEFVYCFGEVASGLKIVAQGTVEGVSVDDKLLWTAEVNEIFGLDPLIPQLQEPSLGPYQHQHNARSATQSVVYELPAEDLQALVRQYPTFMDQLVKDGSKP